MGSARWVFQITLVGVFVCVCACVCVSVCVCACVFSLFPVLVTCEWMCDPITPTPPPPTLWYEIPVLSLWRDRWAQETVQHTYKYILYQEGNSNTIFYWVILAQHVHTCTCSMYTMMAEHVCMNVWRPWGVPWVQGCSHNSWVSCRLSLFWSVVLMCVSMYPCMYIVLGNRLGDEVTTEWMCNPFPLPPPMWKYPLFHYKGIVEHRKPHSYVHVCMSEGKQRAIPPFY